MKIRIIDKTMFRKMPWANGGGVTTELVVHKDESTGRTLWRLSMAGVDTDGPFSHFAGYDRILVLMTGQGLRLSHGNGTEHCLSNVYDMACFPGDLATHATLIGGPVSDFNVIVDRAAFSPSVIVTNDGAGLAVPADANVLAVYAVDHALLVTDPSGGSHHLPQGGLFLVEDPLPGDWRVGGATALVVQLSSAGNF